MKLYQETTTWKVPYRPPNHVYLMEGDRAYAYSKWGVGKPEYFRTPTRLDKRGRKFVEVKDNSWGFDLTIKPVKEDRPTGKTWAVQGSKGNTYTVSLTDGHWNCTCPGATFRGSCRHIESQKLSHAEIA